MRIYDRLKQSPVSLDILYDWSVKAGMNVSRRTLYRYLNNLATTVDFRGEKLLVTNNEFNKKVWKIEYDESSGKLNQFDINSYYILRNFIPNSLGGPRLGSLKKLDEFIYSSSSKSDFVGNVDANNLAFIRTNYFDANYSEAHHNILEEIIAAIQHHRKICVEEYNWDIKMLPEGFKTGMLVLPIKLLFHFGLLYTCVYVEQLKKITLLPLSDILKLSVVKESFNPGYYQEILNKFLDTTFGILPNFDNEIYDIEIEFAGNTGKFIQVMNWHHSQKFSLLENGNMLMQLHCGINRELVGFVMYFLDNARVLKPANLKNMVIAKLAATLSNYTNNSELVYSTNLAYST